MDSLRNDRATDKRENLHIFSKPLYDYANGHYLLWEIEGINMIDKIIRNFNIINRSVLIGSSADANGSPLGCELAIELPLT